VGTELASADDPGPADACASYAGQSVGAMRARQTVGEIVDELMTEAEEAVTSGTA
jgi:hypothetical protein